MITFVYEQQKRAAGKVYDTAGGIVYSGAIESITRAGGTATVTKKNHGFANAKALTIAGADQAAYNGAITVGGAATDTFTYAVAGTPATPATGNLYLVDADQSVWMSLPEALHIASIAGGTTLKVEARIDSSLPWVQVGADLTSADNGKLVTLGAKYNFVRLRRSTGSGAAMVYSQS